MPIQPIKIPQNVYIEDRIIGPLTLKQIIVVSIGCGISYMLWASISKSYGYVGIPLTIVVWIPGALSVLFSFVKINDLSLMRIVFLMVEKSMKPSLRTWEPRQGIALHIRTFTKPQEKNELRTDSEHAKKQAELQALTGVLDLDTKEEASPADEPLAEEAAPKPVQRERISASPGPEDGNALDTIDASARPRVSLLRDIA